MIDYSQGHEQEVILAHTPEKGRFLDIGAFHPTDLSNTRALYERGWSGVMVEPSPAPFLTLLEAYGDDPRITLVHAPVVFAMRDLIPFYITDDAVSSTDEAWRKKWQGVRVRQNAGPCQFQGKALLAPITLEVLMRPFGTFDFISIDVEGQSVDLALQLMRNSRWTLPGCLCVEHDDRQAEILPVATPLGYRVVTGPGPSCNLILVR